MAKYKSHQLNKLKNKQLNMITNNKLTNNKLDKLRNNTWRVRSNKYKQIYCKNKQRNNKLQGKSRLIKFQYRTKELKKIKTMVKVRVQIKQIK